MFETQGKAKRFLVEKVLNQAEFEGTPLSPPERQMLSWSESDPEFALSPEQLDTLVDELALQMSDEQYEWKIAALLGRSYERDVASESSRKSVWKAAYSRLNEGDHYILVMLDQALGRTLGKNSPNAVT
jgi:hypothetical protein